MSERYDDEHWCGECGHIGYPRLIDETWESTERDNGTIEIECVNCQEIDTIYVSSGGDEIVSYARNILYNSSTEEFETKSEQQYNLLNKTNTKAESNPIFQQLANKLCLLDLDHEIISISTSGSYGGSDTDITIIVAKEAGEIIDVAEEIMFDNSGLKYSSTHIDVLTQAESQRRDVPALKFSPDGIGSQTNNERSVMTYTSKIKNKNRDINGYEQVIIEKIGDMKKDIFAKKIALKDPIEFDTLAIGDAVRFSMHESNGYFHVDEGSLEVANSEVTSSAITTKETEEAFLDTLNKLDYPFLYFDKSFKNYSNCFKANSPGKTLGRPDFILCKPGLGTYVVDVSNRNVNTPKQFVGEPCITISKDDFKMASRFHRTFCLPWWWAVRDNTASDEKHNWHMLSLFDFEAFYREQMQIQEEDGKTSKYIKPTFINIPLTKARKLNLDAGDSALFS